MVTENKTPKDNLPPPTPTTHPISLTFYTPLTTPTPDCCAENISFKDSNQNSAVEYQGFDDLSQKHHYVYQKDIIQFTSSTPFLFIPDTLTDWQLGLKGKIWTSSAGPNSTFAWQGYASESDPGYILEITIAAANPTTGKYPANYRIVGLSNRTQGGEAALLRNIKTELLVLLKTIKGIILLIIQGESPQARAAKPTINVGDS
jgi:hypothetical protein